MPATGKKFTAALGKVDRDKQYAIPDAVKVVKAAAFAKFNETVDMAVRLGVDPRHARSESTRLNSSHLRLSRMPSSA